MSSDYSINCQLCCKKTQLDRDSTQLHLYPQAEQYSHIEFRCRHCLGLDRQWLGVSEIVKLSSDDFLVVPHERPDSGVMQWWNIDHLPDAPQPAALTEQDRARVSFFVWQLNKIQTLDALISEAGW